MKENIYRRLLETLNSTPTSRGKKLKISKAVGIFVDKTEFSSILYKNILSDRMRCMPLRKKPNYNPNTSSNSLWWIRLTISLALLTALFVSSPNFTQGSQRLPDGNKWGVPELSIKKVAEKNDTIDHQKIITMNVDDILKMYPDNGMEIIREHTLMELNKIRQTNGLEKLSQNQKLTRCAQDYAEYLYNNNRFEHKDKSGVTHTQRIKKTGYPFEKMWENLAKWTFTIKDLMILRKDFSQEHLNQINRECYFNVGIWYCNGYWVANFGWM